MIKKVLVESDGFVSHIFHDESWEKVKLQDGQTLEDREYEQLEDGGWYPKGQRPLSEIDQLKISQAEQFETMLNLIGGI